MTMTFNKIEKIVKEAIVEIGKTADIASVEATRVKYLGRKAELTIMFKQLTTFKGYQRSQLGRALNQAKQTIAKAVQAQIIQLKPDLDKIDYVDLTKPGEPLEAIYGHYHPTSLILAETYKIFTELGFAIVDGPEVESDWYNFEVLNQPSHHPARDMQDTFYILDQDKSRRHLPRTQTSAMQVRFMEENRPPFKIIVPGKVFRNEDEDRTHSWSFYQIEGLVVGEGVSLADLKGTLLHIVQRMFGERAEIRLRPSYFPYTEPSVEIDAKMGDEWLELGGAGMVHPNVLKKGGIDPSKYTGFAFGWGVERIAVIKYGLTDLRKLWRPNLYFLEQF